MDTMPGTTERVGRPARRVVPARTRRAVRGPDRLSVLLFATAAILVVVALLAGELHAVSTSAPSRRVILLRQVYRTTVVETVPGSGSGTSISQSVSSSGSGSAYSSSGPPTTRSSSS
jgi:hypothetical protein